MKKLDKKTILIIGAAVTALLLWYLHRKKQAEAQETFYPTAPATYYGSQEAAGNFGNYGGGGGGLVTGGGMPVGEVPGVTTAPPPETVPTPEPVDTATQEQIESILGKHKNREEDIDRKNRERNIGEAGYVYEGGQLHKTPPREPFPKKPSGGISEKLKPPRGGKGGGFPVLP